MKMLYDLGITGYRALIQVSSLFSEKAQKWVQGRKAWETALPPQQGGSWIWFHCASLGEFEQGRNLIDQIKREYPQYRILVTFFSPSGFEVRKQYRFADHVMYLPLDTPKNANAFLDYFQPKLAFFIKYELWLNFLFELESRHIPTLLVAARVQESSGFFNPVFKDLYQTAFRGFRHIFTQDQSSLELIQSFAGTSEISVSADTRFDRVSSNAQDFQEIPPVAKFIQNRFTIVVGSSWPKDESILFDALGPILESEDINLIIAPHEIHAAHIQDWVDQYPHISLKYSERDQWKPSDRILWIDNIGMLSQLYGYADVAYVGGAWRTGLHNILEPAVFGPPVLYGPKIKRFPEATDLKDAGGGFVVKDAESMRQMILNWKNDDQKRAEIRRTNQQFIQTRAGATDLIMNFCRQQGLL
ncbi:glycosyltransferase N-terminal domain-containing protein [Pontibacter sp. G13]|uniref:3-deoxy-D-manno-octulosonic acid transferase n=1 Tax=Pontibacter sp. G13 TaxID=3074898 RepID=UPI00288B013C|nr:glycosyltransferase N-terminal domain-containing protein [Pontibacter sp. G13]WNJ16038.1 glycosyltransferase N-terminal domain-containing protein [Pontibacter sp. G13]